MARGPGHGHGHGVTIRPKQLEEGEGEELPECHGACESQGLQERGRLFEASGAFYVWACMG